MSGKGRSNDSDRSNASGTGRSSGGRHHESGKNQSSESSNDDNNVSSQKKMTEQRFAHNQPRKAHSVTCNQLRDCVVPQMQQTCDHGSDMANSLRQSKDQVPGVKPMRQTVKMTAEEAKDEAAKFLKTLEQQGHDLKHKEEL